jgi:hypothetical protein
MVLSDIRVHKEPMNGRGIVPRQPLKVSKMGGKNNAGKLYRFFLKNAPMISEPTKPVTTVPMTPESALISGVAIAFFPNMDDVPPNQHVVPAERGPSAVMMESQQSELADR